MGQVIDSMVALWVLDNHENLSVLPAGIYIVNGKKAVVK